MNGAENLHATCIRVGAAGVLLLGPPGAGKSSLALAMMDSVGRGCGSEALETTLVADDRVIVEADGKALAAHPPAALAGLIEVRGLGLARAPFAPRATLRLAARLTAAENIERLPRPAKLSLLGRELPEIRLDPFAPGACARLRCALAHLGLA